MLLPADRRRTLGAFLRSRREALDPSRSGLGGGRRRTPGLRREEVADLCGISVVWYTWAEQGRDIALSPQALARLAEALTLTAAERTYLFELTLQRDPAPLPATPAPAPLPDDLAALVGAISAPAYLLDRLWCRRAWNEAAADLFGPWRESNEPNLLLFVFRDPAARSFIRDWEDRARRLLAEFRADAARFPGDPDLRALADTLLAESPEATRFWHDHAVLTREGGARRFDHPERGAVTLRQLTLVPASLPDGKLVVLLPAV